MTYWKRIIDAEFESRLSATGAVVIEGPKACGKTSTAQQKAASQVLLDVDAKAKAAISVDPKLVLEGDVPRLIDEWQTEPEIWNYIRREVDERGIPGQFILTGSAVPADDITRHTGAGRLTRLHMRPMTLFETGYSTGNISFGELLDKTPPRSSDPGLSVGDISEQIVIGGWPGHISLSVNQSIRAVRDYLEEIRRVDIGRVDQKRRDPRKVGQLIKSVARNTSTTASIATLSRDTTGAESPLKEETARDYLFALERLMVVEDQPAWSPNMRSRARLRSTPKRHFVDPSLAVAALRATPDRLLNDLELLGLLFESMVVRDLRVYAQASDAQVFHYRDSNDLEVDAIVEVSDGRWAAFEVKLGHGKVDEAAQKLLRFSSHVDSRYKAMLGVIVGTGLGYMRGDGVAVIPIGALGP